MNNLCTDVGYLSVNNMGNSFAAIISRRSNRMMIRLLWYWQTVWAAA